MRLCQHVEDPGVGRSLAELGEGAFDAVGVVVGIDVGHSVGGQKSSDYQKIYLVRRPGLEPETCLLTGLGNGVSEKYFGELGPC